MSEEYFDRAHNNLLDILSTGGLISLLAYLSIFSYMLDN
jgi:O-antigen ligase